MSAGILTDAEFLVLGLVAEMPRHGYQLDQVIEERGMRRWTQISFSSIYFVLGRLEEMKLVAAKKAVGVKWRSKARKVYSVTPAGRRTLVTRTVAALREIRPAHSSVFLGMMHWPVLNRNQALQALRARLEALEKEQTRLKEIQIAQQPLPDHVEALFEFSIGQLRVESEWVKRNLDYMSGKPWLD